MNNTTKDEEKFLKRLSRVVKINKKIDFDRVPAHIAFIMDGNGRWAKRRGMPRKLGHRIGYNAMILSLKRCIALGIKYVSVYAFSTENWNRPQDELDEIFRVVRDGIHRDIDEFMRMGVKLVASGDTTRFPDDLQDRLQEVTNKTKDNTKCTLNLCINYGGRTEIIRAANAIMRDKTLIKSGVSSAAPITEDEFAKYLYTAQHGIPDPDLIVRTSGEMRISNFMLWQMAYSEFIFIPDFWPSMDERLLDNCIIEFQRRNRRFGKV